MGARGNGAKGGTEPRLDKLIEHIYESILSDDSWADALRLIADITGSMQASLVAMDRQTRRFSINENFNVVKAGLIEYNDYYHQHDPSLGIVDRIPWGHWYYDRQHFGVHAMRRSEYYQDFMRRHGLASTVANRLVFDDSTESCLSLQRVLDQPHYEEADMRGLEKVIPHLQRALRLRARMQALEEQAGVGMGALDKLRVPLLVTDEAGRTLLANTEAEAIMRRNPAVSIHGGRLHISGVPSGRLEQMLRTACGIDGPAVASGAQVLGGQRQATLQVIVTPLPVSVRFIQPWSRPLALVLIHDPEAPQSSHKSLLQQLYGLTPAEARVAWLVLRGATPAQAAQQAGVSIATVRSQLKAVFQKTGTTRQAELIRLLSPVLALEQ